MGNMDAHYYPQVWANLKNCFLKGLDWTLGGRWEFLLNCCYNISTHNYQVTACFLQFFCKFSQNIVIGDELDEFFSKLIFLRISYIRQKYEAVCNWICKFLSIFIFRPLIDANRKNSLYLNPSKSPEMS